MSDSKSATVVPLKGENYPTWKIQVRMALMKENLWSIVSGTESAPTTTDADRTKFNARKDKALAIIVLSVDPSLLYLLGDPDDPIAVWKKLADQFQKKSWANKLKLRRKLYSLRLNDSGSVQEHIKEMSEIFESLSVIGDPIKEEDRVVHLLASLPDSYNMLVTALEANADVPEMAVVTERLLHEERKIEERRGASKNKELGLLMKKKDKKGPKCHHCGKLGHIKRNCWKFIAESKNSQSKEMSNNSKTNCRDSSGDSAGLVACNNVAANLNDTFDAWIIDSGATSHMSNDIKLFCDYKILDHFENVSLGDGHSLSVKGKGNVHVKVCLPGNIEKSVKIHDVLHVPGLSYNLLSIPKVTNRRKVTVFNDNECKIYDMNDDLFAVGRKEGNLYFLNCKSNFHVANQAVSCDANLWHKRLGHLSESSLQKMVKNNLVNDLKCESTELNFCEPCTFGKNHRKSFPKKKEKEASEVLGLVHSDVCGKMGSKSLSDAEYFLTFLDEATHYVWVYFLKKKSEVFDKFMEWKSMVENSTGKRLKTFRTDNGGEYTSSIFEEYLRKEGVKHEKSVPKTPEQNGASERLNRTIVEAVRSMLVDSGLDQKFWAEAASTTVYLRNISHTSTLKYVTPYEALHKKKPSVEHLRVFGCVAYSHIPKDERQKLDSKSKKSIMLGYGSETKGYRLYDPEKKKVFYSRDVIFNETELYMQKESSTTVEKTVEISFSDSVPESEEPQEVPAQQNQRPTRERRPPNYYGEWTTAVTNNEQLSVEKALKQKEWNTAMKNEIQSMKENDVWELVELPAKKKLVSSKWVFKEKSGTDGGVLFKARLVAQGFTQKKGLDYDETFSPVARFESVRAVIALAVKHELELHQMDVTCAFLNGNLNEEVYMKQPEGFIVKGKEQLVCKLKKSIYGLKQSPRCWNFCLDSQLLGMGLQKSQSDPCIYNNSEGEKLIVAVYVDDLIIAGKSSNEIMRVKQSLSSAFKMKDLGKLKEFLGVSVVQKEDTGDVWLGQPSYTDKILETYNMSNCKPISTPVDPAAVLTKKTEESEQFDAKLYQSAVGSLLYLSTKTRPDLTFAVNNVARFCANPSQQHWTAVKRIFRYLKGTQMSGLLFTSSEPGSLVGYSDADWAGDREDRKSTSGYTYMLSGAAISWRSKKQQTVALSTAEAEYTALSAASQEALWLRQLMVDLGDGSTDPTLIYEDNQAAIAISKNPQYHARCKHIDIKYHFVRDQIFKGSIAVKYCPTENMIADMFTKALSKDRFIKLCYMIGMRSIN